MDLNLKNKVAFVTGSSKGIGKEIARQLQNEGCIVIINGRNKENLKKTAKKLGIPDNYIVGDVTDTKICKKIIKEILKKCGRLDILICNSGGGNSVSAGKEKEKDWNEMFKKNFLSADNIIKSCEKELSKTKGSIVCISSIAGVEITGAPITYSIAKSSLNFYVKSISKKFARKGIRINSVSPGNILFKGSVWERKLKKDKSNVEDILKTVAMNRLGKPEEVAKVVVFIASDSASFMTGSNITVDGGQIH